MEYVYTQTFTVTDQQADSFGSCKPSALLWFAQQAAESHCLQLGTDWDTMAKKGLFWAVIRQRLQITRLPMPGQTITVKTWPMPTTRVAYPRATEGFDEAGNSLFRIISIWVLMDKTSRAMVLPGKSGVTVSGTAFGTELKAPAGLPAAVCTKEQLRSVCPEDLDRNGHMNNARYLDWITQLPDMEDRPLKAVTICYMSEALEGQQLRLGWSEGMPLQVDGSLAQTDDCTGHTRIFSAQLEF